MEKLAIKIEHVTKQYRLGTIGGGTLRGDLQSFMARIRGQEDPNSKIGSKQPTNVGERFFALNDINFEVKAKQWVLSDITVPANLLFSNFFPALPHRHQVRSLSTVASHLCWK